MRLLVALIVAAHGTVFLVNTAGLFIVPWLLWDKLDLGPWSIFIAVPIDHFLVNASHGHECPLTKWENACRAKAGLPQIPGFIEHYIGRWLRWR